MPSKNRKHFAALDSDGTVLDSVSSDKKQYRYAYIQPGKKTKWLEEDTGAFGLWSVTETPERLMVGQTMIVDPAAEDYWMDEQALPTKDELADQEAEQSRDSEAIAGYHEQVQAARAERVSLADMKTHHDSRPKASKPAPQRVYKTGQRWTKPGTGIVARVYLVKEDGRAYARGNRRNLSAILLDDSWELAR